MGRRVTAFTLVVSVSLIFTTPVRGAMRETHGVRGESHGARVHGGALGSRSHHHGFQQSGCCFGPVAVGQAFLGLAVSEPSYTSTDLMYADAPDTPASNQRTVTFAPPVFCYVGGCYRLRGDGGRVPYQWVWVPAVAGEWTGTPPAPPPLPAGTR